MAHKVTRYGWLPDLPDQRDHRYTAPRPLLSRLPAKVDLRKHCPPVYDQGSLGSCTANAIGGAIEYGLLHQSRLLDFMPSRLFIYYNERVLENTTGSDSGAMLRDGMKTVNRQGVCTESLWPYRIEKFADLPSAHCYEMALDHQVLSYHRVPRNLNQMKSCLAEGFPFVFGFTVYESFESAQTAKTGRINMPKPLESVVGGHAVMAVGYDHNAGRFIVRNSWGNAWGQQGYFTMPFGYLMEENLSDDFWTIRMVEGNPALKKKNGK